MSAAAAAGRTLSTTQAGSSPKTPRSSSQMLLMLVRWTSSTRPSSTRIRPSAPAQACPKRDQNEGGMAVELGSEGCRAAPTSDVFDAVNFIGALPYRELDGDLVTDAFANHRPRQRSR